MPNFRHSTVAAAIFLPLLVGLSTLSATAQSGVEPPQAPVFHLTTLAARPRPRDARMEKIVADPAFDASRIKAMDNQLIGFGNRVATSDFHPGAEGTPGATAESTATRGVVPARQWIESQFQEISRASGGRLQVSTDTFAVPKGTRVPEDQTMSNVVAILPGTDPNDHRVFVVSGHYDTLPADFKLDGPGANDDASGTIISMESARALAKYKFPATIEFLTVEGEEQGLYGSRHAAAEAKAKGEDIAGMLNDDMDGGDQTPGYKNTNIVRIFSQGVPPRATPEELRRIVANSWENDSPSRELARFASEVARVYLPRFTALLEYRPDRFQRGGDQEPFVDAGYPAVRFSEYHENSNHQHKALSVAANGVEMGDRGKWISPAYIGNVARVNALTLAALASSPLPPKTVYFRGGQAIGTPVEWTPVAGAAGYRILLRPTASPQWTIRIPAPPVAAAATPGMGPLDPAQPMYEITIPQSPDNYFIAVVSLDQAGHESLPTLGSTRPFRFGRGRGGRGRGATGARGRGIGGPGR
ncbi:MAG: M20/M25/M40 family metallo-hydrolase [Terriglobales bacterium]